MDTVMLWVSAADHAVPRPHAVQQQLHTSSAAPARHCRHCTALSQRLGQDSAVQEVSTRLLASHYRQRIVGRFPTTGMLLVYSRNTAFANSVQWMF